MRISSSVEYATRLMSTLAREGEQGPVPTERLAEIDRVPADVAAQILVRLRRSGLVTSRRGTAGGYVLSRSPEKITLAQLARAVDGDIFDDVCGRYDHGRRDCRHQGACSIAPVWQRLGRLVNDYFEGVTLAAILAEKPAACGGRFAAYLESYEHLRAG